MCVGKVGNSYSQLLPQIISDSLGIALYAMFIGLLVPNVKNNIRLGTVVILAVLINVMLLISWLLLGRSFLYLTRSRHWGVYYRRTILKDKYIIPVPIK